MGRSTSNATVLFYRLLAVIAMSLALNQQPRADGPQLTESVVRDDRYMPDPPRQEDEWKAPASDLPWEFGNAVRVLCRQGFADPRGCEYRAIQAATTSDISSHAPKVRTHGWVLPPRDARNHPYAVCWNGLVYPVIKVEPKADLDRDVKAFIEAHEAGKLIDDDGPRADDERSMWHGNLGDPGVALLLRLGRGDLAADLWFAKHPNRAELEPSDTHKFDPYVALAEDWSELQFKRAKQAFDSRDYRLATYGFHKLGRFAETAEAEAKQRGFKPSDKKPLCFKCLERAPEYLRDLEYRAPRWPREPVVCIGAGKCDDQKKRIASLIDRLDEVNPPRVGISMRGDIVLLNEDVIVRALIIEGAPALEPLMECFKHDDRLTRTRESESRRQAPDHYMSVRKAAYAAMCDILDRSDLAAKRGRIVTNRYDDSCQELAGLLDEPIKQAKQYPRVERLFQRLADDKATPEQWHEAAKILLSPREQRQAIPLYGIRGSEFDQPDRADPDKLIGEPLRDKKNPSVTNLVLKRIKQSEDPEIVFDLVCALARWNAKAAQQPLAEQMQRLLDMADSDGSGGDRSSFDDSHTWERYVKLLALRTQLGDKKALDEYAAVISRATRTNFHQGFSFSPLGRFGPMADQPNHPTIKAAAAKLFADDNSSWVPLIPEDRSHVDVHGVMALIPTKLLRHEAFRKAVLKELENKSVLSTVTHHKDRSTDYTVGNCSVGTLSGTPPLEEIAQDFRVCDYCAHEIGGISGAPRCELFWTEAERDKAVAACAEFLHNQQFELYWRRGTLKFDKPATREQVAKAEAVFSLAGEDQVRVVQGLKLPLRARWTTLKDHPRHSHTTDPETGKQVPVIEYEQEGEILQAEEIFKDGKWQRYYGFVGAHRIARVKAEEIDLSPSDWDDDRRWLKVGDTLHARLELPASDKDTGYFGPRLSPKDPVDVAIIVRNASGLDQEPPPPEKLVRLRLLYSPETISRQGKLVPKAEKETAWQELPVKPDAKFKVDNGKVLLPADEVKLPTLNLRDWFDVSKPGFYRLQLLPAEKGSAAEARPVEVQFSLAAKK